MLHDSGRKCFLNVWRLFSGVKKQTQDRSLCIIIVVEYLSEQYTNLSVYISVRHRSKIHTIMILETMVRYIQYPVHVPFQCTGRSCFILLRILGTLACTLEGMPVHENIHGNYTIYPKICGHHHTHVCSLNIPSQSV